ncbi:FliH/SctL family protein [Variovorax boronicumulans]|uniref:FliH/SctL family protein n=1 Tax=Variovorax boronicumulans TaxID=436515 RepID=UPI001C56EFFE
MRGTFIPSEDIAGFSRWQFATVGPTGEPQGGIADPAALSEAKAQGFAEGHAAGRAEALAQARGEMEAYVATQGLDTAQRLAALLAAAEAGLADAQQDIARGTLEIACALARQVLRHELATQPLALEPVVREAIALLRADGRSACVRLAPPDFEALDAHLRAEFAGQAMTVVSDASVTAGDCRVESAGAVVDGGVATRWSRAVASLGLAMPWHETPALPEMAGDDSHAA